MLREMENLNPGLPSDYPHPTLSFWLGQTRNSPYLGYRTTEDVPKMSEVVIIGSGLSGVATAYFLLTAENPPSSVTLLEAREICHSATGRNGGHCRPDTYRGYAAYKAALGSEQALKIIAQEWETFELLEEIINKENLREKVDYWKGNTYDVAMDDVCAAGLKKSLDEFTKDGGNASRVKWSDNPEEVSKITRVPDARAAAEWKASSFWPYKFVCALLDICVEKGLNIQSNTPALQVVPGPAGAGWHIETPRGHILAEKVLHATNAFAGTLLQEFQGKISPFRGQCSQIAPTKAYSGKDMLTHSYSIRWAGVRNDFDYLMQRPADGSIILGGGRWVTDIKNLVNQTDDTVILPEMTKRLGEACSEYFKSWGPEAPGEGLIRTWTGVMGYTHDAIPYCGELEGRPGQFILAGHSGHGMARIASCARGIAKVIQGEEYSKTGLPECFQPTSKRLNAYPYTVQQQWSEPEKYMLADGTVH